MNNTISKLIFDVFPNISSNFSNFTDISNRDIQDLPKKISESLPGRKENQKGVDCNTLSTNDTLSRIIPGWEGIPTNIVLNFFLSLLIVIGFAIIIWRVNRKEKNKDFDDKTNPKSDWLHFIYGNKKSNEDILYTSREINREHPNAYLPIILHDFADRIKCKEKEEPMAANVQLYRQISVDSNVNTSSPIESNVAKDDGLDLNKEIKVDSIGAIDSTLNNTSNNEPTIRSKSMTVGPEEEEEEFQIQHLKSVLWNEDISTFSRSSAISKFSDSKETFFHKISKYVLIKDKDILRKRGQDSLQYLLFQRYVIYFLICLSFICLLIILPINIFGDELHDKDNVQYKRTTILNIRKDSNLIWIHLLMTLLVFAMGIFLMFSFKSFIRRTETNIDKKILMIENIPVSKRNEKTLKLYFKEIFPKVDIKRITFVYDIDKIFELSKSLWTSIVAKNYCIEYVEKYGQKCEVRPYLLGNFLGVCGCCRCFPKVDGLSYYKKWKIDLEKQIDEEITFIVKHPQRIAFVVFDNTSMAEEVYKYYRQKQWYCYFFSKLYKTIFSHPSDPFETWRWNVSFAPFPDDIKWSDIGDHKQKIFAMKVIMNLLIVVVFLFLSTPQSALSYIRDYMVYIPALNRTTVTNSTKSDPVSAIFWAYFPTITLLSMASILPAIIRLFTTFIPHQTKSGYNHAIMQKSYIFLLIMVLFLPSLRIFKLYDALSAWMSDSEDNGLKFECIFPTENGAFFINYVLAAAFVGNAIELTRTAELFTYIAWLLIFSRNSTEYMTARQSVLFEFQFGIHYPRILLLFTIIVTFSISSPLIAPLGLLYMTAKHLVDRYLIYYVYVPSKMSQKIHSKAMLIVYFALLLQLIQVSTHLQSMQNPIPAYILGVFIVFHLLFVLYNILFKDICHLC